MATATTTMLADAPLPAQSLDLGFLDEFDPMNMPIPDLNDEMVPVDSFFSSYVEGLEMGAREGQNYGQLNTGQLTRMDTGDSALLPSLSMPLASDAMTSSRPLLNGVLPTSVPQSIAAVPQTTAGVPASLNDAMVAAVNGVPQTMALPQPAQPTAFLSPASAPMPQIPAAPATSETSRGGRSTRGMARSGTARYAPTSSEQALHQLDHEKTKRNPKQQLQNKQAQQRYRERRKQRFNEMEATISVLNDQLQAKGYEVAGLQNQNAALQGKAKELTEALSAREAELAALKAQLAAGTVTPSSSDAHSSGTAGANQPVEGGTAQAATSAMSEAELQACRTQYDALVSAMRDIADQQDLRNANLLGEGVAPAVLEQVRELVASGCRASQELDRKGGIHVLEVMGRDVDKLGAHSCATERARLARVLEALQLTPRQEEALLALRKQHLARLKSIYQERQSLNMRAMGMMLPSPAKSDVHSRMTGADPTLEGKMACMSIGSYLDCARNTLQLDGVLDALKENLRDEQRAFLEMKLIALHRVLSPIQTLLFVVECYPTRVDALALANSVALKLGRATEGCPKAAELLKAASAEADRQEEEMRKNSTSGASSLGTESSGRGRSSSDDSHKSDCCSLNRSDEH